MACHPENHIVNTYDFDFIVGADGKRNSLPGKNLKINIAALPFTGFQYRAPITL